jgi:hypothetical protein
MEPRFGLDFSQVRVHTGELAAASAQAVNARAYAVGQDIVFGAGQLSTGKLASHHLLAHELTHVAQQMGATVGLAPAGASQEQEAESVARNVIGGNGPTKVFRSSSPGLARQPTGGPPTGSPPGVLARYTYSETHLPGGIVRIRVHGTVGDPIIRPGLEKKYPLPKDVNLPNYDRWHLAGPDATGAEAGIAYAPKNFNVSKTAEIENVVRNARAQARANGGDVYFDFSAECRVAGEYEGVQIRVLERATWKVEIRPAGSDKVIPLLNETASPQVTTAPAPRPPPAAAKPPTVVETPPAVPGKSVAPGAPSAVERPPLVPEPEAAIAPKAGGKGSGLMGGVLGVAIPFVAGWIHQKAVERRVQERAMKEGYVPPGAPSGEGFLYDLGSWLIDPVNDADRAVSIDKRLNVPVWRARLREIAGTKKPADLLPFEWDVGKCQLDFLGNQVVETRRVVYRKGADGKWVVDSGDATDTPNLNWLLSPDVSDSRVKALLMSDPCLA